MSTAQHLRIRPYQPQDLADLYRICLLTGDSGEDASGLYRDPDLLGHYYAAPYPAFEPNLTLILADGAGACGYMLGTSDSGAYGRWLESEWLPPLRQKYPLPPEDDTSRDARMIRLLHRGYQPPAFVEEYPAHLHIDLLPRAQGRGQGRALTEAFLQLLRERGVGGVHLGLGIRNQRALAFYERLGFTRLETLPLSYWYGMKLG